MLFSVSHRYMTLKRSVFLGVLFSLAIGGIIFLVQIMQYKKQGRKTNLQ